MLHIVNKSPFERNTLEACLNHTQPSDAVLLIEDAVIGALDGTALKMVSDAVAKGVAVFALTPDIQARGFADRPVIKGVQSVDYAGFVDLVTEHEKTQSWL